MTTSVKAEFFVQVKPEFGQYYHNKDKVIGLRAVRMTQKKPEKPESGCFVVKVAIEADPDMFAIPEIAVHLTGSSINAAVDELKAWVQQP